MSRSDGRALAAAAIVAMAGLAGACRPSARAQRAPVEAVLHAVLRPGAPPQFARRTPGTLNEYEVLPSPAVLLRMTNAYPERAEETEIILTGASQQPTAPLPHVLRSDVARQRALDSTGYFWIAIDSSAYTVGIVPPASERNGRGFDVRLRHRAIDPPAGQEFSTPLTITVRPQVARTLPGDVFFDCPGDVAGWWLSNCKPGASAPIRSFTIEGILDVVQFGEFYSVAEDVHYYFVPDVDFVDSYYGATGMMATVSGRQPFAGVSTRGNPALPPQQGQPLEDRPPSSTVSRLTINSLAAFASVHKQDRDSLLLELKAELNAWHVNDVAGTNTTRNMRGRGAPPAGWHSFGFPARNNSWVNTRFPYSPTDPDGRGRSLAPGDCVRITGPLYLDSFHGDGIDPGAPRGRMIRYGPFTGWFEIHPPDWIERIPCPAVLKTPILLDFLGDRGTTSIRKVRPVFPRRQATDTLAWREIVDARYTNAWVTTSIRAIPGDSLEVTQVASADAAERKSILLIWWESVTPP